MRAKGSLLIGLSAIAIGIVGIMAISILSTAPTGIAAGFPLPPGASSDPRVANVARIYFAATDSSGRPIPYRGGMR